MRFIIALVAFIGLAGCTSKTPPPANQPAPAPKEGGQPHAGHSGMTMPMAGENGTIMVTTDPAAPAAREPVELKLMIHEPGGQMVEKFDELHTKQVHLIVIRQGLDEFAHLHPDIDASGNMTISHTFRLGGEYMLFADYKPAGKEAAVARGSLKVGGASPPAPKLTPNVPGTIEPDGLGARIDLKDVRPGESGTVTFHVIDDRQEPVENLQPYLGAMGHLVIVSADGRQYVHAHPLNESAAPGGVVEFMAHFPVAGVYKGWGQFQRSDTVYTVPFVVQID